MKLISKFVITQLAEQTTAVHVFPNISRSENSQAMKFIQLIEYNTRNIFLKKSYQKMRL